MKALVTILLTLLVTAGSFAKDFEGTLDMSMTTKKHVTPITYSIKGKDLRFEMQTEKGPAVIGLFDGESGEMTMLMPAQSMYMTFSAKDAADLATGITFEETGRTETIAGRKCTEFLIKDKKTTSEVWATSELGGVANLGEAFGRRGKRTAWEQSMIERGLFALRVVTKNPKGVEISRMECTAIHEKKLEDTLFEIPEGYKKLPGLGDLLRP